MEFEFLELSKLVGLMTSFVPIGFIMGFIMLLLGLAVNGIMKIFKKA